ncbi:uncharacterized protein B0I36DRAFT_348428 [Microdochium trichocladiopsis]|uniref:Ams2/SPT21 N-terminal domain-containing protein n=1 Tax=Microdochium trichocladiopsis TaxID=1682393 RepID=A0A9P8Y935_9PEZI|nr:uncharacterized protein B0I36DRAFT_348428 [Microdochium trichocladiopsis]KAH7033362.1 hypothetical protein B0I36DRAFT_348428 [Microdochium trichocladiopsis]
MAHYHNNNGAWAASPSGDNEAGVQSQPMGLKVHYTFDKDSQERCLARWPHTLNIQTVPVDERNSIGVVDLRTCLQAVAQCSPEIMGDGDVDYTVYAFDYSEPDTPLVGQGMLSRALNQGFEGSNSQPQLVTGRVTRNLLAIFGNGVRETLEVRLKLTAVSRPAHAAQVIRGHSLPEQRPNPGLHRSMSTMSEASEWNSFIHSNPNLGQPSTGSATHSPALAPARPYNNSFDARNEPMAPVPQISHVGPSSRPSSVGPTRELVPIQAAPPHMNQSRPGLPEEAAPIQSLVKPAKPQSRPSSRASSRAPTGRPRGRPRKKPQPVEGHTSGYEDGTDADDGPPTKKRATTTKVERSNTATFGSAPDSLRVAASTSGSIRNFRPIVLGGEAQSGGHLQEIPRAPTPVPIPRLPNRKLAPTSSLRRESTSGSTAERPFTTSYLDVNRSATQNQDGRSPESAAPSPFQIHSDEPSPAEIGSSPPVPRSAMYSMRSSPAPSSPILPPMPASMQQVDSGFMSGGIDDGRVEDDELSKLPPTTDAQPPVIAKPKPKRSRSKKQPVSKQIEMSEQNKVQTGGSLVIHAETPGPPELLPQTSIYNPPHSVANRAQSQRKASQKPNALAGPEASGDTAAGKCQPSAMSPVDLPPPRPVATAQIADSVAVMSPDEQASQIMSPDDAGSQAWSPETAMMSQADLLNLMQSLEGGFGDRTEAQHHLDSFHFGDETFTPLADDTPQATQQLPFPSAPTAKPQPVPTAAKSEKSAPELELPVIPASDPVFGQLSLPMPASESAHPRTDAPEADGRSNKNYVKRQAIKQKLEEAILLGQMPTFCRNCGALQTPTWRKIWKQTHKGIPAYHEYSEKAGCVTAINILTRDENNVSTSYEMIKKALGPTDDKSEWTEISLCNPCGIWFSKWKKHRPAEKWEKDESRLNQTRKKRSAGSAPARSKKPRTKSDGQMGLTSDACLPTDPLGPLEAPTSPKEHIQRSKSANSEQQSSNGSDTGSERTRQRSDGETKCISTHSRGSGRANSPIDLDDGLGPTRRLLFPSPRKDGETKTLGEVAVNIVQTSPEYLGDKMRDGEDEKENQPSSASRVANDDFADLFGPTPARPSTPPPKSAESMPFKTPTRPPSHRPVTRSVTHSVLRSGRSLKSPNPALMLERTPTRSATKTPRSSGRRRTQAAAHNLDTFVFDSPMTKSINQMLSEANGFDGELDLSMLNSDDATLTVDAHFDFSALLSTDAPMPSSPPILRHGGTSMVSFGGSLTYEDTNANIWGHIPGQEDAEKQ